MVPVLPVVPNIPRAAISADAIRASCSPETIEKMEEVARIMRERLAGNYTLIGNLLDILVSVLNTLMGYGITDEKLQGNIEALQDISAEYSRGIPLVPEEEAVEISFVKRIEEARVRCQANQENIIC